MSQETCETKSIRPTRYLIVKDLGCSCRAEEETLTASRPCQPISHLLLKEQFAFAAGPFHPGRCGEVCFYRSISSSSTTISSSSGKDLAGRSSHAAFSCGEGRFYSIRVPLSTTFSIHLQKIASLVLGARPASCGEGRFYVNRVLSSTLFFDSSLKDLAVAFALRRTQAARGVSRGTASSRQPFSSIFSKNLRCPSMCLPAFSCGEGRF